MAQSYFNARSTAPQYLADDRVHRQAIARVANGAVKGQIDCTLSITLNPNVSSTPVTDSRISTQTAVILVPVTAHAASEAASGSLYVTLAGGSATIFHTNSAVADRTFIGALIG